MAVNLTDITTMTAESTLMTFDPVPDEPLPGMITRETRLLITDVISCGLQPVIMIIGLAGNILSMSVLTVQGTKEVTNIILIGLTMVDLLYLIFMYGPPAECFLRRFDPLAAIQLEVDYKFVPTVITSHLGTVSRLYTCLIAVERYIAVIHPFRAPALLTRKRIFIACVVLTLTPFVLSWHSYMLFSSQEVFSPEYNTTINVITFSKFTAENVKFVVLYHDLILALPFVYLPVVVVFYCTFSILVVLRRSQQQRQEMTGGRKEDSKTTQEQRQVTKILIGICIVFIVCSLPTILVQGARLIFQDDGYSDAGRYRNLSFATITISLVFSLINSSVNFIFYVAYSRKFKATAKKIWLCWRKEEKASESSMASSFTVTATEVTTASQ